jgi:hypothetical protein
MAPNAPNPPAVEPAESANCPVLCAILPRLRDSPLTAGAAGAVESLWESYAKQFGRIRVPAFGCLRLRQHRHDQSRYRGWPENRRRVAETKAGGRDGYSERLKINFAERLVEHDGSSPDLSEPINAAEDVDLGAEDIDPEHGIQLWRSTSHQCRCASERFECGPSAPLTRIGNLEGRSCPLVRLRLPCRGNASQFSVPAYCDGRFRCNWRAGFWSHRLSRRRHAVLDARVDSTAPTLPPPLYSPASRHDDAQGF